ncbi:MAG: hypothetical protein IJ309_06485 [Clostridia bacterium]|nr:hypothetical protein [Clostridia bacterium]
MKKILLVASAIILVFALLCSCGSTVTYEEKVQYYKDQGYVEIGGVEEIRNSFSKSLNDPQARVEPEGAPSLLSTTEDPEEQGGQIEITTGIGNSFFDKLSGFSGQINIALGLELFQPERGVLLKHTDSLKQISVVEFASEKEADDYLSTHGLIGITYEQEGKVVTFFFSGSLYY